MAVPLSRTAWLEECQHMADQYAKDYVGQSIHATLQTRLREALAASPDSLEAIARRAGYSPGYVRALAGRSATRQQSNPTVAAVWAIAEAARVDPLWLLGA